LLDYLRTPVFSLSLGGAAVFSDGSSEAKCSCPVPSSVSGSSQTCHQTQTPSRSNIFEISSIWTFPVFCTNHKICVIVLKRFLVWQTDISISVCVVNFVPVVKWCSQLSVWKTIKYESKQHARFSCWVLCTFHWKLVRTPNKNHRKEKNSNLSI